MPRKRTWKRVLYEKQPYRDNFYDPERFFAQLIITKPIQGLIEDQGVQAFTFASVVAQQFSAVAFFFVHYKYLELRLHSANELNALNFTLLILGLVVYYLLSGESHKVSADFLLDKAKMGLLFVLCLRIAAPVLQTLTLSFSADTVYALAIALATVHLVFHDYAFAMHSNADGHLFSGAVSLNAAIFTSVLLASRLADHATVMSFILLAVIVLALFPVVARALRRRSLIAHWTLVLLHNLLVSSMLYRVDVALLVVYLILLALLCLLAPLLFLHLQRAKMAFHGPWDVAADL